MNGDSMVVDSSADAGRFEGVVFIGDAAKGFMGFGSWIGPV